MKAFTKYGTFMYNVTTKSARFLDKYKWLYYLLACTWGSIMTLLGLLISLVLLICGKKPHKCHTVYFFKVGDFWGGFEMGLMFVRDKLSWDSINYHELGHTYQNCVLGPLFPLLVAIPSAIRYWYRELKYERKHVQPPTEYDDIWFEKSATDIGEDIKETCGDTF